MGSPNTTATGQIVPRTPGNGSGGGGTLVDLLDKMKPQIALALPRHMTADRMTRIALTALRVTKDLALCTPASFAGCIMQSAQLGLEPNTPLGHLYLIPRKSKRLPPDKRECTMIIGYQGEIELVRRSGLVSNIYAHVVRAGDAFAYELGLNPSMKHVPSEDVDREAKPITHVYCVAAMRDSTERVFVVLTRAQIEARRKRSAASNDGPWITDYEAMCLKTGVRALWKWLPKSPEMARAEALEVAADMGRSQAVAFDPDVAAALAAQGLAEDAGPDGGAETDVVDATESQAQPWSDDAPAETREREPGDDDEPQAEQPPPPSDDNAPDGSLPGVDTRRPRTGGRGR